MKVKGEVGLRAAAQANVELKTDVKAEVEREARQSLFAAVVQAKYARGLVVSDFERCKGFCSGEGSLPFLHCVNCLSCGIGGFSSVS